MCQETEDEGMESKPFVSSHIGEWMRSRLIPVWTLALTISNDHLIYYTPVLSAAFTLAPPAHAPASYS